MAEVVRDARAAAAPDEAPRVVVRPVAVERDVKIAAGHRRSQARRVGRGSPALTTAGAGA